MKILILVNTLQAVNSFVYSNHIQFFTHTAKTDPTIEFLFFTPHRMAIDTARNNAAKLAMEQNCDYLMFIDDDVMIPPETLIKLLKTKKDIIAGLVIIRGMPFHNMAFKFINNSNQLTYYNDLPLTELCKEGHTNYDIKCPACKQVPLEELVEVNAVGFSCCLIHTDILKAMEPPYFITGVNHTEDIYFCLKTQELDPAPKIFLHTGIQCGHLLNPEPIEWNTRKKMQDFYDEMLVEDYSRNQLHIDKCLAKLVNET